MPLYPVTPKICMVCKTYTGKGNLCSDPRCKKIMESQFRTIFDDLHKRSASAKKLRDRLDITITKFGLNAKLIDTEHIRHIEIQCDDQGGRNVLQLSIEAFDEDLKIYEVVRDDKVVGLEAHV